MAPPAEGEVEALLSEATAALRDGSRRLDVLDEAVTSILATMKALSTVLDRLEGEVAQLRNDLESTRKIAKQAKKRAGKL
jgi:chromosome segregation ATPase